MLLELSVRNLAVMARADLELGPGLSVLTGETGAGKSILVDSLLLLAGGRAATDLVRTGEEALAVAGRFRPVGDGWSELLADAGVPEDDGTVLVRREVRRRGSNRAFVNDTPVTARLLRELAPHLLAIHGQRDELSLADAEDQRAWLDRAGGEEAGERLAAVESGWTRHREVAERLARLEGDERLRWERADLLKFQAGEIDAVGLEEGEEDRLREERDILRHGEVILEALSGASEALMGEEGTGAAELLGRAGSALEEISRWERAAEEWASELDELRIRAQELGFALERRREAVELDPGRLDWVEARLATLERVLRKYGPTSADVLARRGEIAAELEALEADDRDRESLEREVSAALEGYRRAAVALTEARARWARHLSDAVAGELVELSLPQARFGVRLDIRRRAGSGLLRDGEEIDFGPFGVDQVRFEFSPNPGEELRPLARVASGGELARLYLALQLGVGGSGELTLVFDEVDAGVGGAEAAALGGKLARVARGGQVLAVTHLPQVASCADAHFRVRKEVVGERTVVRVERLGAVERVEEVARMLAGTRITETSRSHARELIAQQSEPGR